MQNKILHPADKRMNDNLDKCKTVQDIFNHLFKYEFESQIYNAPCKERATYLMKLVNKMDEISSQFTVIAEGEVTTWENENAYSSHTVVDVGDKGIELELEDYKGKKIKLYMEEI